VPRAPWISKACGNRSARAFSDSKSGSFQRSVQALADGRHVGGRVDDPHARGLGPGACQVRFAHTPEKGLVLTLEAVELLARAREASARHFVVAVEHERAVRRETGMGSAAQPLDELERYALAGALVGVGRVEESVAHHPASRLERGTDHLAHVVRARGEDKQRLGQGIHRLLQDRLAQLLGEVGAAGLARDDRAPARGAGDRVGDELQVRGLARAVDALQGDEPRRRAHFGGRRSG
jgi:hypothetical protein